MGKVEYNEEFSKIEQFSKAFWVANKVNEVEIDQSKEKMVILDFFPYPSGVGLHIGHPLGYIATDIYARFWRLKGKNVLFAMGYDAFGLPAEQFAIEHGVHPEITTKNNIANISRQLEILGLAHDPKRSFSTTDKDYYKWTQWIFLQLYNSYFDRDLGRAQPISILEEKLRLSGLSEDEIYEKLRQKRLTYLDEVEVNWCPKLGTVLADEEVINGVSERGGYPVFRKPLEQWVMRITEYGPRLVENLEFLNWPISVKEMQRNWVGLSSGHEVEFQLLKNGQNGESTKPTRAIAKHEQNGGVYEAIANVTKHEQNGGFLKVYTTRLDTLEGVTFCAISVDHPQVLEICTDSSAVAAVKEYKEKAAKMAGKQYVKDENFAVFSGSFAINPVTGEKIPVFAANYVLSYGTAAVMGVPAHDERDHALALALGLKILPVVKPTAEFLEQQGATLEEYLENPAKYAAFTERSQMLNGLSNADQVQKFEQNGAKNGAILQKTNMKLRDWIFSRQRYWGEPFPIVLDKAGRAYGLESDQLPLELPDLEDFHPQTDKEEVTKPLDKARVNGRFWKDVNFVKLDLSTARIVDAEEGAKVRINGREYEVFAGKRETNTMPNWAGSCWYFLRYMDPRNGENFVCPEAEKYWSLAKNAEDEVVPGRKKFGAIDLYLGGAEHAVLHLLYARFWYLVLYDLGFVSCPEPFDRLFNQGMLLGPAYQTADGKYVLPTEVENRAGKWLWNGQEVVESIGKIGKRYKNGVPPEEVCGQYSVDVFRLYMMYLGPLEQSKPWDFRAIKGMARFLEKVCRISVGELGEDSVLRYKFNETVRKMEDDFKALKFNTAIAALIIFVNFVYENGGVLAKDLYEKFLTVLAPLAPHLCEFLYQNRFDNSGFDGSACSEVPSIFDQKWPVVEDLQLRLEKVNVVVTVNGRKRAVVELDSEIDQDRLDAYSADFARENSIVPKKVVIVRDDNGRPKLINIVE